MPENFTHSEQQLHTDIRQFIEETRKAVSQAVNAGLTRLYWNIGKRINDELLNNRRAEYGQKIVASLARQLTDRYGKGFPKSALTRMSVFHEKFPDSEIVATLSQQLSWSHFIEIIPLKLEIEREFYALLCRIENWSVRTLRQKIQSLLFERTAISRKPEELAKQELQHK